MGRPRMATWRSCLLHPRRRLMQKGTQCRWMTWSIEKPWIDSSGLASASQNSQQPLGRSTNTNTTYVTSATFQITQGSKAKALIASDLTIHLGTISDSNSTWTLSLETLGPAPFYYSQAEWTISTESRDE